MGLLSAFLKRAGRAAVRHADEPATRLPVNFTRELGPNAMPIAPKRPFRESLKGGSEALMEDARKRRRRYDF